jgi:hypothetical protein
MTAAVALWYRQDLHTGVDGGAFNEPVTDLVKVLGTLVDSKNHIQIPGFNEGIRHYADIGVPEAADALRNIEECEISIAQVSYRPLLSASLTAAYNPITPTESVSGHSTCGESEDRSIREIRFVWFVYDSQRVWMTREGVQHARSTRSRRASRRCRRRRRRSCC